MNRREWLSTGGKAALVSAAAVSAVGMEGCNAEQWIQTALADLPTIVQIVTSILSIASAAQGGVPASVLAQVNAYSTEAKNALTTADSVIQSYKAAQASARPGLLGQIDSALVAAQTNLSNILSVFQVTDQTMQATVAAAVGSAITVILAIQALVPAPPSTSQHRHALQASAKKDGNYVIKSAYNLIVGKNYPQAVLS